MTSRAAMTSRASLGRPHWAAALFAALLMVATFLPRLAAAQITDLDNVLEAGIDDAALLTNAYLAPATAGFGAGLNTGWAGAARPLKRYGLSVRVGAALAAVPSGDQSFTVAQDANGDFRLEDDVLQTVTIGNPGIGSSPTVGGDEGEPTYRLVLPDGLGEIDMPEGTGIPYAPAPIVQASVGIGFGTELMVRFVPQIEAVDEYGSINLLGLGAKYDLSYGVLKKLPFNLTLMGNYTSLDIEAELDEGRQLEWANTAWSLNMLAGKTLSVLSVYAGGGIESSSSDVAFKGTYDVTVETDQGPVIRQISDPIDLSFDGRNTLRGVAGVRLRLTPLALYAEGTLAEYSSVTAGIGLSFR
jgi:hypothetical protein